MEHVEHNGSRSLSLSLKARELDLCVLIMSLLSGISNGLSSSEDLLTLTTVVSHPVRFLVGAPYFKVKRRIGAKQTAPQSIANLVYNCRCTHHHRPSDCKFKYPIWQSLAQGTLARAKFIAESVPTDSV